MIDSPCYFNGAVTRLEIFCTSWDAKGALKRTLGKEENVLVLSDPTVKKAIDNLQLSYLNQDFLLISSHHSLNRRLF